MWHLSLKVSQGFGSLWKASSCQLPSTSWSQQHSVSPRMFPIKPGLCSPLCDLLITIMTLLCPGIALLTAAFNETSSPHTSRLTGICILKLKYFRVNSESNSLMCNFKSKLLSAVPPPGLTPGFQDVCLFVYMRVQEGLWLERFKILEPFKSQSNHAFK